ncbi:MAG: O-antigen ligase family protein [Patescibacteria group bacterium]|jgi:O-antigen ligase
MGEIFYSKNRYWIVLFLGILFFLAIILSSYSYLISFLLILLFFLFLLFFLSPLFVVYLIALFLPVTGFALTYSPLEIPFIDLLSLLVLSSFLIRHIYIYFFSLEKEKIKFPQGGAFLFFFLATLLSGLFSKDIFDSLWYSFRWILFFYLAFVVLPFNTIKNLVNLKRVLTFISLGGFLVALMGLVSLFLQDWQDSFFRVKPLFLFGDWIFGENYNLLAEFLILSSFIVLSLKYWFNSFRISRFLNVLAVFLIFINFLTFGRTAWITIFLQIFIYLAIEFLLIKKRKIILKEFILVSFLALILIAPFFVKMLSLQEANVSSTENRLLLTQISWSSFWERPLVGHGSGSFVSLVEDNIRFVAKYGDPLDSHGFGQKVLAENGILGTIAFLLFLFFIFRKIYLGLISNQKDYKLLLPLFVASFGGFFYQLFNTSYYKGRVWLPIAIALIAVELIDKNKGKDKND